MLIFGFSSILKKNVIFVESCKMAMFSESIFIYGLLFCDGLNVGFCLLGLYSPRVTRDLIVAFLLSSMFKPKLFIIPLPSHLIVSSPSELWLS